MASKRNTCTMCKDVAVIACIIYLVLVPVRGSEILRILLAIIALIAAAIKLGIELANDEPYKDSALVVFYSIINILCPLVLLL